MSRLSASVDDWQGHTFSRLAALPEEAEPLERAQLLAAQFVGTEIIHLGHDTAALDLLLQFEAALQTLPREIAPPQSLNSPGWIITWPQLNRSTLSSPHVLAAVSLPSATPSPTTAHTSIQDLLLEVFRDQPTRRLRCAHLDADALSLAGDARVVEGGGAIRVAASCVAPGTVRPCHAYNRVVVNCTCHSTLRLACHTLNKIGGNQERRRSRKAQRRRVKIVPVFITLATVGIAIVLGRAMWEAYVVAPWTRDSRVRAYVVTMAPEVSGRIVEMPVLDNQFVHKGDVLMVIDRPTTGSLSTCRSRRAAGQGYGRKCTGQGGTPAQAERSSGERRRQADPRGDRIGNPCAASTGCCPI